MPVHFQILKEHSLVYVRSSGVVNVREQEQSFQDYAQHPDFAPGHKYLIDMRPVTGFDGDYMGVIKLHSAMGEKIPKTEASVMFVYMADTELSLKLCRIAVQSLSAFESIVACVAATEAEALEILGLPVTSLKGLKSAPLDLMIGDER